MTRSNGWVPGWTLVNLLTQYDQIFLAGFALTSVVAREL